ncbi:MAG: glycine oxidase ThiO [Blastopirellula sp.]|nr:glycine oxidase ThiO [Blastopirellula sp.]
MTSSTSDFLIVGGGVVGLSIAYELAHHDVSVRVIDRQEIGREASWAGAGILPPANRATATHPYDHLCGFATELHAPWAAALAEETGIDTGYRKCGGIYLARSPGESAALVGQVAEWREQGITVKRLTPDELAALEPGLATVETNGRRYSAYLVPEESQLRNPLHLKALQSACRQRHVDLIPHADAAQCVVSQGRLQTVVTSRGEFSAGKICLASGAWSRLLLEKLNIATGILPIRGQMVLLRCSQPPFRHILNQGPRYLVPREDGLVLIGSTEEEVGFDKHTTDEAIAELRGFAADLVPSLATAQVEQSWAGLRPGSFDGFPYLGKIPGLENAYVAAGHFRSGLFLSPATAVVMSELMRGTPPSIDLDAFRVGRG